MRDHKKRRVRLDHETIRHLAHAEMGTVQGGGSLYPCSLGAPEAAGCCSNAAGTVPPRG